jgi:hypothetical protein
MKNTLNLKSYSGLPRNRPVGRVCGNGKEFSFGCDFEQGARTSPAKAVRESILF